jgi:NADH:ubiquinone oxidoreductase subunit 2 (subunit N)
VISIGYYFALLRVIPQETPDTERLDTSWLITTVVAISAVGLIVIFVVPNAIAHLGDVAVLGTG